VAALNKSETEALRNAVSLLEYIEKHGYDAEKGVTQTATGAVSLKKQIKAARDSVRTVVQMKGYYPS
jgi:hypothetical protein